MAEAAECVDGFMWQARASACELLALSMRYPDAALADIVASGQWADAASEIWGTLDLELPDGWATGVEQASLQELRVEATRLFVGTPAPVCSPYEGFWRAGDDGVQPLMFVNPHSMEVQRFCKACGLGRSKGANEPLDHLATEFELLQYLASVEGGMAASCPGRMVSESLPGGSAQAAYDAFLSDHVRAFAPRMAALMKVESRSAFYRATACLIDSYLG